jgi:hypothetical protein
MSDDFVIATIDRRPPPLRTSPPVAFVFAEAATEVVVSVPAPMQHRPAARALEMPRASAIVDDEFTEIGQKLPVAISAIPDDRCSSESDTSLLGSRRTSGLSLNARSCGGEEEEDTLLRTVEIRLPMKGRSGADSSDYSGWDLEFIMKECHDRPSDTSDGMDF